MECFPLYTHLQTAWCHTGHQLELAEAPVQVYHNFCAKVACNAVLPNAIGILSQNLQEMRNLSIALQSSFASLCSV